MLPNFGFGLFWHAPALLRGPVRTRSSLENDLNDVSGGTVTRRRRRGTTSSRRVM
ncbi:MAG: hypothetical protein H6592_08680 [Flavobacteriales bacterium]|nr:hypothetical protein [Flavobacteriales bacterium]